MTSRAGTSLVVLGAGSLGRECGWLVDRINAAADDRSWDLRGYVDQTVAVGSRVWRDAPSLGPVETLIDDRTTTHIACAIGDPAIRSKVLERALLVRPDLVLATLIDPTAIVGPGASVGAGCLLFAQSIVSIDSTVGTGTILDKQSAVGHDTVIGECCMLYPGARVAGNCALGDRVAVGAGANIIQELRVGSGATIGAGAVVIRDIPANSTAVGVPSHLVPRNGQH